MSKKQFVTFEIDHFFLGIDILMVREINRILDITNVPQAPGHVLGLINLRGRTVTVFDLGIRLGLGPGTISDQSHNIIFKIDEVGLLVDRIGDVISVEEERIEPPPANTGGIGSEFIKGVVELENTLLMILSARKVLEIGENDSKNVKSGPRSI